MPSTSPGFAGLSPTGNPYIRMPDGRRMLWSEINDASMAMDLGGVNRGGTRGGPSIQVVPNSTPRPSRGLPGDSSGVGLVNRNPLRHNNQANTDWWVVPRDNTNRLPPHSAMDFDGNQMASGSGGRIVDTGASGGLNGNTLYSPTPSETFGTTGLHNYGEPNVEVSGFPDQRQRWDSSSNSGGSIWSDDLTSDPSGAGTDGLTYTPAPNIDDPLDSLNWYEPENMPESAAAIPPDTMGEFNPNEWENWQYTEAPPDNDNDLSGLHNYGYQGSGNLSNFGGNMSLGPFLDTPLSDMRFGEGYPQIGFGGRPDDLQPGEGYIDPGSEGGTWVDRPDGSGADWVENARSNPNGAPPLNDGTGTTTINRDTPTFATPPGMTIIGHDQQNGQPIYQDAQGNLFVNEGTGARVYPTERMFGNYSYLGQQLHQPETARNSTPEGRQAANAAQMSFAAMNPTMNLKFITAQSDRGRTLFNTSGRDRPNISLEGDVIVRQPSGSTSASRSGVRGMMGG